MVAHVSQLCDVFSIVLIAQSFCIAIKTFFFQIFYSIPSQQINRSVSSNPKYDLRLEYVFTPAKVSEILDNVTEHRYTQHNTVSH